MAYVAVIIRYVTAENERRLAARPAHRDHLSRLRAEQKLVNAGPFEDGTGALLVYRVDQVAEVDEIMARDPYPADTYTVESVNVWNALFDFGTEEAGA